MSWKLNLSNQWWDLMATAGAVIAVAFFIAQLTDGFLFGLGLLLFGTGERINHPMQFELKHGVIVDSSVNTESSPREPTGLGVSLDAVGIWFLVIGLFLMVFAP